MPLPQQPIEIQGVQPLLNINFDKQMNLDGDFCHIFLNIINPDFEYCHQFTVQMPYNQAERLKIAFLDGMCLLCLHFPG